MCEQFCLTVAHDGLAKKELGVDQVKRLWNIESLV